MIQQEIAKAAILHVARKLGHLCEKGVFLGGSVTALLITDPAASDTRPTKDVDIVVRTESYAGVVQLEEELRKLGINNDTTPGAPTCRWIADGCLLDVVPVGVGVNVYTDRWSPIAIEYAQRLELEKGLWIRHVTAPFFIAIKLEAFADRGEGNYQDSQDIEDIIYLIDGRPELGVELQNSGFDLRSYVAAEFRALLDNRDFREAIFAHLLPDAASQAREVLIVQRMENIILFGSMQG